MDTRTLAGRGLRLLRGALIPGLVAMALLVINWAAASWMLWRHFDKTVDAIVSGDWPFSEGGRTIELKKGEGSSAKSYAILAMREGRDVAVEVSMPGQELSPVRLWSDGDSLHMASLPKERHFAADAMDPTDIAAAVREVSLPNPGFFNRLLASLVVRPFVTAVKWDRKGVRWRIHTSMGALWLGRDSLPYEAELRVGDWQAQISDGAAMVPFPEMIAIQVPAEELSSSVAETIRIVGTLAAAPVVKADEVRRSGAGWLEVRDGHTQMFLEGSPYEIGHQHGRLDPKGVGKVCRRLVYGVGLLYSFKKGEWFPKAARELVERQHRFIAPAYFEEMRGLADGAGLPLELIQMANIFPEFFHCSGVALMGEATVDGELLHARVLDYMVGIGLQDHAAVMAITRPGVNRFVTVGYLGFIGSVTGMNEKQVAIGEMGGDGQGDWDGIPMSLLIRQALEDCDTLGQVETFMRESPRTCEYYYVISDGKGPSALGVAATPTKFETFGPGVWQERLARPVKDAVLLSGPGRYDALVERVQENYGKITRDGLIEIIRRPVAMKSNLHNVIFQPQSLRLSVADATRDGVACDQPYRTYTWDELFSAAASR